MSSERFTPLWPEVEPLVEARQPRRRLPKPNAGGWIEPLCSPLREDKHPSFSVMPDSETDPGGYVDHGTGEKGSMANLARRLGIEVGGDRRKASTQESRPPMTLEEFARIRGLDPEQLRSQWKLSVITFNGTAGTPLSPPALGVDRIKYTDNEKPKYELGQSQEGARTPVRAPWRRKAGTAGARI